VWVAGDAGVGKSTVLDTFTRVSGAAVIAQGQCIEQYGTGEPYLPVLQALGDLARAYPELGGVLRSAAPTWLLQLPWLLGEPERAALARELVGVSQERMVREFHELVVRFTERRPLLLVIEDLHWCDEATLPRCTRSLRARRANCANTRAASCPRCRTGPNASCANSAWRAPAALRPRNSAAWARPSRARSSSVCASSSSSCRNTRRAPCC
jgi:hypothetical protein